MPDDKRGPTNNGHRYARKLLGSPSNIEEFRKLSEASEALGIILLNLLYDCLVHNLSRDVYLLFCNLRDLCYVVLLHLYLISENAFIYSKFFITLYYISSISYLSVLSLVSWNWRLDSPIYINICVPCDSIE